MKFTEKIIIILGLLIELVAIGLIFCFLSSCKVKRQAESKSIEKSEFVSSIKTEETVESSAGNVLRIMDTNSIDRDVSALFTFFRFSIPDSTGSQYVTEAGIAGFSDKSKLKSTLILVDSVSENTDISKFSEENLKGKAEVKQETKVKNETETSGLKSIVIIIILSISAILIIKNKSIWIKAVNLLKRLF